MRRKSNVFDLAIASLLCISLTNIQSTGLMGGFLLTAHLPSQQKSIIIDAQMSSPENFPFSIANFSEVQQGSLSIAIPGFLKGIWEVHKKYGSIEWFELIEPIIELCKNGIVLSKHLRDSLITNQHILNDIYFRKLFIDSKTGKVKRTGTKIVISKQCDFLEIISKHNSSEIYSDKVGDIIMHDLNSAKSIIKIDDFINYKVKINEAKKIDLNNDYSIIVPNTCATLIPSIIKILLKYKFNSTSFDINSNLNNTILSYHRIVETFKHVFAMRSHLSDPDFKDTEDITNFLISDEFANHVMQSINDERVKSNHTEYNLTQIVPNNQGTSHTSIICDNGDSIAVTSSINFYFGSGIVGNKSGLVFNNGMDDFSYPERSVNYFGLQETSTNYPEPQKRALTSVSPIILVNRKTLRTQMVIGAAGGSKIISAVSIAIFRYLCCTNDIKEIIDAPRFHHQLIPNLLEYEFGWINDIVEGLTAKGHVAERYRHRGTIINALTQDDENIYAISDYRKDSSGVAGF